MVLNILASAASAVPSGYWIPLGVVLVAILVLRAFSQGRRTNRERDMHGRVVLITGAFSPLGSTLMDQLAQRGAHILALSPDPVESPQVSLIVDAIRSTTKNENIYADQCDLTSPVSVRSFCTRFLTGKDTRLDAIVFAHEYTHIGSVAQSSEDAISAEHLRQEGSLATFLIMTLLLPTLLVAPPERDIRIISVVNRFYAAAIPTFSPNPSSASETEMQSLFLREGARALRTAILTRHLQRVLDALPSGGQVPQTEENVVPVASQKAQRSNIVAVSVSPGISRSDTIAPLLGASSAFSAWRIFLYILLQPVLRVLTKSPSAALQSVLHVLFLPTPFKAVRPSKTEKEASVIEDTAAPEELLKPGALYAECAVVRLNVPVSPEENEASERGKEKAKDGGEAMSIPDDGEMGGERAGRLIWESFEAGLKAWEQANPETTEDAAHQDAPAAAQSGPSSS